MRSPLLPVLLVLGVGAAFSAPGEPPTGPFGLSRVTTSDGKPVSVDDFLMNDDCALCHERQYGEMNGSLHSVAHVDRFYRAFAERAREEAGDAVYAYCSGCHSAAGVVSGLIPGTPEEKLPAEAKAGVTCDVCHQIARTTGTDGPWGEPGNASFALEPGTTKLGSAEKIKRNPAHEGARRDFYETSEYCASCHTIIHPVNGLRIEHTYAEWKASVYAEKGVQCQDCHMRSVEDAREAARTLRPVSRKGGWIEGGPEREIAPHVFVGANVNAHRLGGGKRHSETARERLKSAAELEIRPAKADGDGRLAFDVVVKNVGAGHMLPTSLTELREMWVELTVTGEDGRVLHRSGVLDEHGEIPAGAIRYGAVMEDAAGKVTVKPWEGVRFRSKKLVPPKGEDATTVALAWAGDAGSRATIRARLLYRSAPPHVVEEIMKDAAFAMEVVEMAAVTETLEVR